MIELAQGLFYIKHNLSLIHRLDSMQKSPQCLVRWQLVISKSDVEIILRRERGGRNRYETDVTLKRV